jgi:O-antigen/teichoic acid export membrane protein
MNITNPNPIHKGHYLRGMLWSVVSNIISLIAAILPVSIASHILTKEQIGAYYLMLVIMTFSGVIGGLGLRAAGIKFISSAEVNEKKDIAITFFTLRLLQICAISIIMIIIIPFLKLIWTDPEFHSVIWLSIPLIAGQLLCFGLDEILIGFNQFAKFAFISGISGIIRAVFSVLFLLLGLNQIGLMLGVIVSFIFSAAILWFTKPFKYKFKYNKQHLLSIFHFSKWAYGSAVLSAATVKAAEAIFGTFKNGTELVAVYGNAMRIPNLLLQLFESVRPIVLSFASAKHENPIRTTVTSVRLLTGMLAFFSGFMIAFAQPIIKILFSDLYTDSIPLTRVLCFWITISIVNYYLTLSLTADGRTKQVFYIGVLQFLMMIPGHAILIYFYGAMGATISISIIAFACNLASMILFVKNNIKQFFSLLTAMCRSAAPLFIFTIIILLAQPNLFISSTLLAVFILSLLLLKALTIKDFLILLKYTFSKN